ncbi:MAG: metallophosphoesterase [Archangium sp.]|nr:metallophosphoesterase [Archangium sp.]
MTPAPFQHHVAMGDPQAPFATVLSILDRHGLLGDDGRLHGDVQLVSMGDHFDWGQASERKKATDDATAMLAWLSAHPPEQVIIIAGNHDLARVCELAPFTDDASFEAAWAMASAAYRSGKPDPEASKQFLERYPHVPDAECLARDFSCYSAEQQRLVTELLRTRRLRLAHAHAGLLLVHAGVTEEDFASIGQVPANAADAAANLNAFLDARVDQWKAGALDLTPLHLPGSSTGVARGVLFHRPAVPTGDAQFSGPPRRRYDPRQLPAAFPQAIGHIRDKKCRELLGAWADELPPVDGVLRSLRIDGETLRYARGTPADARLYFLDAGMNHPAATSYELFDLERRRPLQPRSKFAISGT